METKVERITDWLYPIGRGVMPFPPSCLSSFQPYVAPNALDNTLEGEAAMRILWPSICNNEWLGVSLKTLVEIITGRVEFEKPDPALLYVSHFGGKDVMLTSYRLMKQNLLFLGKQGSELVVYPTPKLALRFRDSMGVLHEINNDHYFARVTDTVDSVS